MKKVKKKGFETKKIKATTKIYLSGKGYRYFYITKGLGNCKLTLVDSLGNALRNKREETFKALKAFTGTCFFVNLIDKHDIDILKEEFTMIYCEEVPIGYNKGYQYHALFTKGGSTYDNRIQKKIEERQDESEED